MKRTLPSPLLILLAIAISLGVFLVVHASRARSPYISRLVEREMPYAVPSSSYLQQTYSKDPDTVMHGFYHLRRRKDSIAVPRARELLLSDDDYIWLNAALYLGSCKQPESIPYLIKALRHTAARSDPETARDLATITGMDYGVDFEGWKQWWLLKQPNFQFDWTSHLGPRPRLQKPQ